VTKYCRARQTSDENATHVHCMLDIKGYKRTPIIRNNCSCSTVTMFFTNAPQWYVISTLLVLLHKIYTVCPVSYICPIVSEALL